MENYLDLNRASWNERVDTHLSSDFYDMEGFLAGENSLKEIELSLLGDVRGKKILHLQCHFGQDSLSLARMGAEVTGVDLSDKAIHNARLINKHLGLDAHFISCDLYSLKEHLNERFDIIFTSYGTVGWLPDIHKWAAIIDHFIIPGGKFIMVDFHPIIWMMDDDLKDIKYRYFNDEAIIENMNGTYADLDAQLEGQEVSWNHAMSEIIGALLGQGLRLDHFGEYDYSPYNCFKNMEKVGPSQYRFKQHGNKLPMIYSLIFGT